MTIKEKILAAIKAKYPGINLSKKRLEQISAKIEAKVGDDETKIDAELEAYNDYNPLADIAKHDDQVRTLQAQVKPAKKDDKPDTETDKDDVPDDVPAWAKTIIQQNKTLTADLAAIKGEKVANTIREKATAQLKDVPVSYWGKRALPENEEGLEAFVTDVTNDYTTFTKEMTDKGLSVLSTPKAGSGGAGGGTDKAVSADIKNFVEKQSNRSDKQAATMT